MTDTLSKRVYGLHKHQHLLLRSTQIAVLANLPPSPRLARRRQPAMMCASQKRLNIPRHIIPDLAPLFQLGQRSLVSLHPTLDLADPIIHMESFPSRRSYCPLQPGRNGRRRLVSKREPTITPHLTSILSEMADSALVSRISIRRPLMQLHNGYALLRIPEIRPRRYHQSTTSLCVVRKHLGRAINRPGNDLQLGRYPSGRCRRRRNRLRSDLTDRRRSISPHNVIQIRDLLFQ